jgi:hypothetical protein
VNKDVWFGPGDILTTLAREADIEMAYELNAAGYFLKQDINKLMSLLSSYREINKFSGKG